VICTILATIGVTSLLIARARTRSTTLSNDWVEARNLALSGVEHAITTLTTNPSWRTTYTHNVTATTLNLGRGSFNWKLADETDTSLSDDSTDPFTIVAGATVNQSAYSLSVRVTESSGTLSVDTTSWKQVVN
jgi:hypothetical protein